MIKKFALLAAILFAAQISGAIAKKPANAVQSALSDKFISNSGKEFFLTFHPTAFNSSSEIEITVASEFEAEVFLEILKPGNTVNKSLFLEKKEAKSFKLTLEEALCYQKTINEQPQGAKKFEKAAIRIYSNERITVYGALKSDIAGEGFLALPVHVLGADYIISSYEGRGNEINQYMPGYTSIVGAFDGTYVDVTPSVDIWGGLLPGQTKNFRLDKGDVLLLAAKGPGADLSGSKIQSTKPVAVYSGNYSAKIPAVSALSNYTIESELPAHAWGKEYIIQPAGNINTGSFVKVFAKEPATKVFVNGTYYGDIPSFGGPENTGFITINTADGNLTNSPVLISADKPVSVMQYNKGGDIANTDFGPFQMMAVPFEQYPNETFSLAPVLEGDTDYDKILYNIVYESQAGGAIPDDFEYSDTLEDGTSAWIWEKLADKFPGAGQELEQPVSGKTYYIKTIEVEPGAEFKLRAGAPFAVYAYGKGVGQSYGFPASLEVKTLNGDDEAPAVAWELDCDGYVKGSVTDRPNDEDSRSNLGIIFLHGQQSENYVFDYDEFVPGQTITTSWRLTPVDKTIDAKAEITFIDRAGNDTTVLIEYSSPEFTLSPRIIDFGKVKLNQPYRQSFYAKNISQIMPADIKAVRLKRANKGFKIISPSGDFIIPPQDSVEIIVEFSSSSTGIFEDSAGIGDDCFFAYITRLKAEAVKPVIVVEDIGFGDVATGKKSPKRRAFIKNEGETALSVTGMAGPSHPDLEVEFNHDFNNGPLEIPAKDNFEFHVTFLPSATGEIKEQIVFSSDAEESDSIAEISGNGVQPGLLVNGLDFGKRKSGMEYFEDLVIENTGNKALIIQNVQLSGDTGPFSGLPTAPISINPGESETFSIRFAPQAPGKYKMELTYDVNGLAEPKNSEISGTAVLPRVVQIVTDINFGTVFMNNPQPEIRKAVITNEDWEFADDLIISDFDITPQGAVSTDGATYGAEGFMFDKAPLGLPVTLAPGETLEFDIYFIPNKIGESSAKLRTKSDAATEAEFNLVGFGDEYKLSLSGGMASVCIGQTEIINCELKNDGARDAEIKAVMLQPASGEFNFADPADMGSYTLGAGETRIIEIEYTPADFGPHSAELVVISLIDESGEARAVVSGEAMKYELNAQPSPAELSVRPGESFEISASFSNSGDLQPAMIDKLKVTVNYDSGFLALHNDGGLTIGSDYDGLFYVENINNMHSEGKIEFDITANTGVILEGSGELARIKFNSYLPLSAKNSGLVSFEIETANPCVEFNTASSSEIFISGVCALNHRIVGSSGIAYSLSPPVYNQKGASAASIDFSVGIGGHTSVKIYNYAGSPVMEPVNELLKAGKYTLSLPAAAMNSGVYFVRMESGAYSKTVKLLIAN